MSEYENTQENRGANGVVIVYESLKLSERQVKITSTKCIFVVRFVSLFASCRKRLRGQE